MKVTYLSAAPRVSTLPTARTGGPRTHILGLIKGFEEGGHEVSRYIAGDLPELDRFSRSTEAALQRGRLRLFVNDIVRLAVGLYNRLAILRRLRSGRVDLVYERFATMQYHGSALRRRTGAPWVLETNGLFYVEAAHDRKSILLVRLARLIELRAYRRADLVVCISEPLKELVVSEAGIAPEKVVVVRNGVDRDRFADRTRRSPHGPFVVGFVGTLIAWQSLDTLLLAVGALRTRGLDIRARIVGDGPDLPRLTELARDLGISGAVEFASPCAHEAVPREIAGFDAGYAGARATATDAMYHSPLKLYEYAAAGRPLIAGPSGDLDQLAAAGAVAYRFTPGSIGELAHAVEQALTERSQAGEAAFAAAEHITEAHSWRHRADQVLAAVGTRRAGAPDTAGIGLGLPLPAESR